MTDISTIEFGAHLGDYGNNLRKHPTEAQKKAGNYKMGRIQLHGLDIAIENPRGTYRSGRNPDTGLRWTSRLAAHYGYFPGTLGNDGDPVDCFVGEWAQADRVYVINQHFGEAFDEHKCMIGFLDEHTAKIAYQNSFQHGWNCLKSIVPCTISQFRWWLKNGNKSRPLKPEHLPYEGTNMTQLIYWDENANPGNIEISRLLYNLRKDATPETGDLLMDSVNFDDVMEDLRDGAESEIALDAMVVEYRQLSKRLAMMQKKMDRAGSKVQVQDYDASKPVTKGGVTHIAAVFNLTDGQTVTIYFHNPDTTPKTIKPDDELISWKWLLNKKDITIAVAPESGKELDEIEVSRRIMKLAEKNSEAFQRKNGNKTEQQAKIAGLKAEISELENTLKSEQKRLAAAKMKKPVNPPAVAVEQPAITPEPPQEVIPEPTIQQEEKPFSPTHTLRDGTPVIASEDEQGVYIDQDGNEHEDTEAEAITTPAANAAGDDEQSRPMPSVVEEPEIPLTENQRIAYEIYRKAGRDISNAGERMGIDALLNDIETLNRDKLIGKLVRGIGYEPGMKVFTALTGVKLEKTQKLRMAAITGWLDGQDEATGQQEPEDPYTDRIEALRTMPRAEYDQAIDALIAEMESAGVLDQYEDVLTEIDKSRVGELQEMVAKATGGKA